MKAGRIAVTAGALSLAGFVGFVAVRRYIRGEVARTLREDYQFDEKQAQFPYVLVAEAMNLPSSAELADSLVPLWSTMGPYDAIEDVLKNGRKSAYWPEKRRTLNVPKQARDLLATAGLTPEKIDQGIFQTLRTIYQRQKQLNG